MVGGGDDDVTGFEIAQNGLTVYDERRTKTDILAHPLASQL